MNRYDKLDNSVPIPLYYQLKTILLKQIRTGVYPMGSAIPTEMEIARQFRVSRPTVRQAVGELIREGWLCRLKSRGTFVVRAAAKGSVACCAAEGDGFPVFQDLQARIELLRLETEDMPCEASLRLRTAKNERAVALDRMLFLDDEPLAFEQSWLPFSRCGALTEREVQRCGLYHALEGCGEGPVVRVQRSLQAMVPDAQLAARLQISLEDAVHRLESIAFDSQDVPLIYSVAYFCADRCCFEMESASGASDCT